MNYLVKSTSEKSNIIKNKHKKGLFMMFIVFIFAVICNIFLGIIAGLVGCIAFLAFLRINNSMHEFISKFKK